MNNASLPPPTAVPHYLIARERTRRNIRPSRKYEKADLVIYALNVIESIESSKKPSTEAISNVDFVTWYILALFGRFLVTCDIVCSW